MQTETTVLKDAERTPCEVWSRVMGYHRPVTFWNPGKQSEHRDRCFFVPEAAPSNQR
ncbi:anaerobic ribonucleoside-triphosphate reductase [Microbulbifer sp. TRSA002]|uniref:anaerobic ribonucleoside-triphosphate reductase n=1 Tax=Microbulbifer sp. TRSA002 TaxID=3243382 RepID=UPI00403A0E8D